MDARKLLDTQVLAAVVRAAWKRLGTATLYERAPKDCRGQPTFFISAINVEVERAAECHIAAYFVIHEL